MFSGMPFRLRPWPKPVSGSNHNCSVVASQFLTAAGCLDRMARSVLLNKCPKAQSEEPSDERVAQTYWDWLRVSSLCRRIGATGRSIDWIERAFTAWTVGSFVDPKNVSFAQSLCISAALIHQADRSAGDVPCSKLSAGKFGDHISPRLFGRHHVDRYVVKMIRIILALTG